MSFSPRKGSTTTKQATYFRTCRSRSDTSPDIRPSQTLLISCASCICAYIPNKPHGRCHSGPTVYPGQRASCPQGECPFLSCEETSEANCSHTVLVQPSNDYMRRTLAHSYRNHITCGQVYCRVFHTWDNKDARRIVIECLAPYPYFHIVSVTGTWPTVFKCSQERAKVLFGRQGLDETVLSTLETPRNRGFLLGVDNYLDRNM